ncbi:MAG: DnaD domain protein [Clostridium lundense]|nr:DnaD domain protein [Clostridium lundense]
MKMNILENENLLLINPELAKIIGLSESIILCQMNYWIKRSNHVIGGRKWIYNTYAKWQDQFCFFCKSTIIKHIKKLEGLGIIVSGNFNKLKIDRTKWYTIDYEGLDKIVQDYYRKERNVEDQNNAQDKVNDDTDESIKDSLEDTYDEYDNQYETKHSNPNCEDRTRNEYNPNICSEESDQCEHMDDDKIDTSSDNNNQTICSNLADEVLSFTKPIPETTTETNYIEEEVVWARCLEKIEKVSVNDNQNKIDKSSKKSKEFKDIINFFNLNIHLITPHEHRRIRSLYKDIKSADLIIKAMELAVENGARTFNYIEVILYNWMKLHLHNIGEVENYINTKWNKKYKSYRENNY